MTPAEAWEQVYYRFDPAAFGVPTPRWRASRPNSPIPEVIDVLARPFGHRRFVLIGSQGSGKTTELRRVLEAQGAGRLGIFFDVSEHLVRVSGGTDALARMQPWEHLFLVGLVVWRAGHSRGLLGPEDLAQLHAARAEIVGKDAASTLDLGRLAGTLTVMLSGAVGAAVGGVMLPAVGVAAGAAAGTSVGGLLSELIGAGEWKIQLGNSEAPRLGNDDERARGVVAAVNRMLAMIGAKIPVVLVLDGLDRIKDPAIAESVFLDESLLGMLECRLVVSGPLALLRRGRLGRLARLDPRVLTEVAVLDHADPWRPGPGISFFEEVWRLRRAEVPAGVVLMGTDGRLVSRASLDVDFEPQALTRLAQMSGGRTREFIRLLAEVAGLAAEKNVAVATLEMVDRTLDGFRRNLEWGLNQGYLQLLREVAETHVLPDPPARSDGRDYVDDLLQNFWVLAYPNEAAWFFPHPLLTLVKIPRPGS